MSRFVLVLALSLIVGVAGCGKREAAKEVTTVNAETFTLNEADTALAPSPETKAPESIPATVAVEKQETQAPAEGIAVSTELPDEKMIQQALKNLDLYAGEIDGRIGPKTKEAIRLFQSRNGLVVDGKVGPKTWALLKSALEQPATEAQGL